MSKNIKENEYLDPSFSRSTQENVEEKKKLH